MKVLLSGGSPRDCGLAKRDTDIRRFEMNQPIFKAVDAAGGTLEQRTIRVGEDLSDYDLLILKVKQPLSFNAAHGSLGCAWAMSQELPTLIYFDDWQLKGTASHSRSMHRHPEWRNKKVGGKRLFTGETDDELCDQYADELTEGFRRFAYEWPAHWRALLPAFPFGAHKQFADILAGASFEQLAFCDYSRIGTSHIEFPTELVPTSQRRREWVVPTLADHSDWVNKQGAEWDVVSLGPRKTKAQRVTEQGVVDWMAEVSGTLSPAYGQLVGAGWWRTRANFAAATGCVMVGDPGEYGTLGDAYKMSVPDVEALSDEGLDALAEEQRRVLTATYWPLDRAESFIVDTLRWAATADRS